MTTLRHSCEIQAQLEPFSAALPPGGSAPPENDFAAALQSQAWNNQPQELEVSRLVPDYAVPPGETLLETIESLGMSQADLAQRMGHPLNTIHELIKGEAAITAEIALQLEKAFRIPASFWNNAERHYREALARKAHQWHDSQTGGKQGAGETPPARRI